MAVFAGCQQRRFRGFEWIFGDEWQRECLFGAESDRCHQSSARRESHLEPHQLDSPQPPVFPPD